MSSLTGAIATDKRSEQSKEPTVVDLTLDSDFDSDDDGVGPAVTSKTAAPHAKSGGRPTKYATVEEAKQTRKQRDRERSRSKRAGQPSDCLTWIAYELHLPEDVAHPELGTPLPRPSAASTPAMGASVSLPGSAPRLKLTPPTGTHTDCTPTSATAPWASSKPATATKATSTGNRAATSRDHVRTQPTTTTVLHGSGDVERSAKRRKLSTSSGKDIAHAGVQSQRPRHASAQQTSKHGNTTSTPARATPAATAFTSLRAKLNNMNGAPSVHFMNSALKPSASPIPFLDDVPTQAARPLFIGRLPYGSAATGLPSPDVTSPESVSAVVDLDPLEDEEMEVVQAPPAESSSRKQSNASRGTSQDNVEPAGAFTATAPAIAIRAQPITRHSSPREPAPAAENIGCDDSDSVIVDVPVRQSTPRKVQQSPVPSQSHTPALPPVSMPINPPGKTNAGSATEKADHLLIFLKEVKRLKWADITKEFAKDISGRSYTNLQSRYSTTLNKRDRAQDPPTLDLPPRFAAEATIDWTAVHANTEGPRVRKEVAELGNIESTSNTPSAKPWDVQQVRDDGDPAPQRQRARRAAPVNYTWPNPRTVEDGFKELLDAEELFPGSGSDLEVPSRSESSMERTLVTPSTASTLRTEPLDFAFEAQDARLGLAMQRDSRNTQQHLPYLSSSQRLAMQGEPEEWMWDQRSIQNWQGAILHVDFSPAELWTVEDVVAKSMPSGRLSRHSTYRRHLRAILKDLVEPKLHELAYEIGRRLRSRDARCIVSFLEDAAAGKISDVPQIQRLASIKPKPKLSSTQVMSISSRARQRELGLRSRRGWQTASTPLTYQLQNQLVDTLGPKSMWTGASGDIHTVAWSPDGQFFAAGAVAVTDADSMQYNRPNVLMYGDNTNGNIHELGKHCIDRPKTKAGANSTHAMYVSQDSKLYTTVSSVAFSPSGKLMYSAGYDHSVCVWDVSAGSRQPYMVRELQHKAPVDILAVNPNFDGVIATATKRTTNKSIKLIKFEEDAVNNEPWQHSKANFASAKAMSRPDLNMSANALKFDPTGRLLLAGFGANMREDSGLDTSGDICLWDVEAETALQIHGSSRNVFDITFNSTPRHRGLFAVGCVATGNVNRGTRSVVRFYSPKETKGASGLKFTCPLELECTAFDMNDIIWWQVLQFYLIGFNMQANVHSPHDENLFAAGCTDGRSYIWDLRRPDRLLYTLSHGSSLMPLQDGVPHERTDTGVRFLSWGQNARRLYSGSSDGVVRVWDVAQSREDIFVKNLVTTDSGIMSGAFTADYSKLVLGEVNGTANVLEVGRDDFALKDADKLAYVPYIGKDDEDLADDIVIDAISPEPTNTAATEARKWLETGQLRLASMGGLPKQQVIQGPNYEGPFDRSEDAYTQALREEASDFQRNMAISKGPRCDLPGCADNINTTTYEDVGDSGRSADRIPNELRRQWLDETRRVVPGKSKCAYCSRPAIPSLDADEAFCERCSFACFRCGDTSYITGATTALACGSCGGIWDAGALGYECSQQPEATGGNLNVPALKGFGKESYLERLEDTDTAFGDEINALTDYYFGLAIDRPENPPL